MSRKRLEKRRLRFSGKALVKTLAVLAVCVSVGCTLIKQQVELSKRDDVKREYEAKIAEAQAEQQKLEDELEAAGTDEYQERVAREELGLVKPNERVFIDITQQ